MPLEIGEAGQSTRKFAESLFKERRKNTRPVLLAMLFLCTAMAALITSIFFKSIPLFLLLGIFIALGAIIILAIRTESKIDQLIEKEDKYKQGAKGEETVADILRQQLPDDCQIFHDIENDYGNIDHVVLYKACHVFLLETKAYKGKISNEGKNIFVNERKTDKDIINQTTNNWKWLKKQIEKETGLKKFVNAIIVFTEQESLNIEPIDYISIIKKEDLLTTMENITQNRKTIPNPELIAALQKLQQKE